MMIYVILTCFFQFLDPSVLDHLLYLMQRVQPPLHMTIALAVGPLDTSAIEYVAVVLQEPWSQRLDVFA